MSNMLKNNSFFTMIYEIFFLNFRKYLRVLPLQMSIYYELFKIQ